MSSVHKPANDKVLRYLTRVKGSAIDDRPPRSEQRDYWEAGSHPDVVERIWDQLGATFPAESKRVICSTPALVHPVSRVLIAVAIGTEYALRLPAAVLQSGLPSKVRTEAVWSGGGRLDVRVELGSDWILGSYSADEEAWCRQTFEEHSGSA